MGYKKVGYLRQLWCMARYSLRAWMEWMDAKSWAESLHPGWVQLATKAKNKEVRLIYRDKILKAYRGY